MCILKEIFLAEITVDLPEEVAELYDNADKVPLLSGVGTFLFCVVWGLLCLLNPDFVWCLQHFLDVKDGEPTDFYRISTRIGGAVFIVLGIAILVLSIMEHYNMI